MMQKLIEHHVNVHFKDTETKPDEHKSTIQTANHSEHQSISSLHVDNGKTATKNVISSLSRPDGPLSKLGGEFLLSCDCSHYASGAGDFGYSCGYRNIQMILSSMLQYEEYVKVIFCGKPIMPSIYHIQTMIENAWKSGFDPVGARQLNSKLIGTRKWIGSTEAAMFFRFLKANATIVDFPHPTGPGNQHVKLLQWVYDYFTSESNCPKFPSTFQHAGHSRTIIGVQFIQESKTPLGLIILDPSCKKEKMLNLTNKCIISPSLLSLVNLPLEDLNKNQYQIVQVGEIMHSTRDIEASKIAENFHIQVS